MKENMEAKIETIGGLKKGKGILNAIFFTVDLLKADLSRCDVYKKIPNGFELMIRGKCVTYKHHTKKKTLSRNRETLLHNVTDFFVHYYEESHSTIYRLEHNVSEQIRSYIFMRRLYTVKTILERSMSADIFKPHFNASNNGISSKSEHVLIVQPDEVIDQSIRPDYPRVAIKTKRMMGDEYLYAVPVFPGSDKVNWKMGGCFICSSDTRFWEMSKYPIPLHDRREDQKEVSSRCSKRK